jgi:hypothetical protein
MTWVFLFKMFQLTTRDIAKRAVIIYTAGGGGGGGERTRKRNVFLGKHLADPTNKKSIFFYPTSNINYKIKYPPLVVTHICPLPLLWHEFDNCLCNFLQSKVSCCLHMYFLWRHHLLLTNRKMIKIVTLIDSHIVLPYDCWHCFLVFNIWVSHALEWQ